MDAIESVNKIFQKTLDSVDPSFLVSEYADKVRSYYSTKKFSRLIVVGFGKAAWYMAKAIEDLFEPELITDGIIITKYGHTERNTSLKKIRVFEAAHPVPDENGFIATDEIKKLLTEADEGALVLCLVSGGGSALLVSPYEGISLSEKQEITDLLLKAGADITELNAVRKHLSEVKGGRLAEIAYPAEIISLMISDVIGNSLDVIASGPTAPDSSRYQDAIDILSRYDLQDKAPASVMNVLHQGANGDLPDTPKQDNPLFEKVQNIIIGSNKIAIEAAEKSSVSMGMGTEVLSSELTGEAKDTGQWLAKKALEVKNANAGIKCLISGGETTVVIKGSGKGGRNMELALAFAIEIDGMDGITFLSAGTDGTDGPTDAAGAIVDGQTISKAKEQGLNPEEYLMNNDSYNFFKQSDSLVITGPTGTNVMDIQLIIIE